MIADTNEKLRHLFNYARRSTVHYAALLPEITSTSFVDPIHLLSTLPILKKHDLRNRRAQLLSNESDSRNWEIIRTSGVTGEPIEMIIDAGVKKCEANLLSKHIDLCLSSQNWRDRNILHLTLHAGTLSRSSPSPWNPAQQIVKWNLLNSWQCDHKRFLKSLSHINFNIITMMPSVGELLASRLKYAEPTTRICPALILLSGEMVEPNVRQKIETEFDCPVSSLYTLAEVGIVGTECLLDQGYHVSDDAVFVEILDNNAMPVAFGEEGDVVITSLINRALPLIRYHTGDRAIWLSPFCNCGLTSPRLRLTRARVPTHLVLPTGQAINVVRFAKLLCSLDIDQYCLEQTSDGTVIVRYSAAEPLNAAKYSLLRAAVCGAMGPETCVSVLQVPQIPDLQAAGSFFDANNPAKNGPISFNHHAEPKGLKMPELARWITLQLANESGVEAAILTGSALDPEATSRFSDIDLVILSNEDVSPIRWFDLARRLRDCVPTLTVMSDRIAGLSSRAPLLCYRLLLEQIPVIGQLDSALVPWPSNAHLQSEGIFWCQSTQAILKHRLINPTPLLDPIHEAWQASKLILNALRYRYLFQGRRQTASKEIIELAICDPELSRHWLEDFLDLYEIARECRPPNPISADCERFTLTSLYCVQFAAKQLQR